MIKTVAIELVILIAAILIYASTRPDSLRIERSIEMQSTPEEIFPCINSFKLWESWSPWEKIDSQINRTYSGAAEDQVEIYEWSGNKNIGQGRMEITESVPPTKITIN